MFDFSFGKLFVLALIGLLVLGPDKLVEVARTAGTFIRKVRRGWDGIRSEMERELEVETLRKEAQDAARKAEAAQSETSDTLSQMRKELDKVKEEARAQFTTLYSEFPDEDTMSDVGHDTIDDRKTPEVFENEGTSEATGGDTQTPETADAGEVAETAENKTELTDTLTDDTTHDG